MINRLVNYAMGAGTFVFVAILFLVLFVIPVGWVMNLFGIVAEISGGITPMLLIRLVGVFVAPLGALIGWLV